MLDHLRYSLYFTAFLGAIVVYIFRKRLPAVFIWTGLFLFFAGLSQLTAFLLMRFSGNNLVYYHIVILINYGLLYIILSKLVTQKRYRQQLAILFAIGGVAIVYFVASTFTTSFASRAVTVINLVVPVGCLMYFYELLKTPEELPLARQGKFWIGTAFLVHHISSFTYWIAFELNPEVKMKFMFREIAAALTILLYLMLLGAVVVQLKHSEYGRDPRR